MFLFQAEDGIRYLVRSRGLGDVYKRQVIFYTPTFDIAHSVFKVKIDLQKSVVKKVVINQKNLTTFVFDGLNDEQISESQKAEIMSLLSSCLLYTSDAADERSSVDLGGRRIIKKKKKKTTLYELSGRQVTA